MVSVSIPAKISCDHEGCEATAPAQLILTATGGFVFKPTTDEKWDAKAMGVMVFNFCPKHERLIT